MARQGGFLVGIDVGSSHVRVLISAREDDTGRLEVAGKGEAPNRGCRRGNVVNVEATVEAVKAAVDEAEVMAGVEVGRAFVGIAGSDLRSVNARAVVSVSRKDREIHRSDVRRVLEAAQAASLPNELEILHAIPQEFLVDDQGGIIDPVGMLGSRLEANVHLVTGNQTRTRTLQTCLNRAGIEVTEVVFEPLATAEAVLTHDERELGALLVDIGSGGTEYGYFAESEIQHSGVLPIGASHFTNDLAMVLRTPFDQAERIKIRHGCCLPSMVDDDGVSIPSVAGGARRVVPKRELCEILGPRAEEMLTLVRDDLRRNGCDDDLRGGVVLTGGGAQLDGLLEMVEQVFAATVRYGLPTGLGGLVDVISSPSWCTASGLLLYGLRAEQSLAGRPRRTWTMRSLMGSLRNVFTDLL